uniref:NADH dehydrogenase subunit 6 n=1 Tax=Yininemertes pratensis TaxID=2057967 RepID=A0A7U3TI70_9BILA|nr:NADH dehydrogenase subunit 6 [Yininemertes pratensis]QQP01061.1 NADH dehydrogenase subunit 6 [Yininemertes pratensis]
MSLVFCLSLVLSLLFILPLMQQGVSLIVVVLLLAVFSSFLVGLLGFVWYGFSLFLIYVGSLLVMFGYVVAMVPNFLFKHGSLVGFVILGGVLGSLFVFKCFCLEGPFDVGGFMYSSGGCYVLLGLGFVLLFTLVCVVKVCYFSSGALRPFEL